MMKHRSFRIEREFGLLVGSIFFLMGFWWIYRGKFSSLSYIVIPVGLTMVLLALTFPRALYYPNKAWTLLAEGLSFVSTRIILAIVFFLVITPIGVVKRLFGWDPLNRRGGTQESYWRSYPSRQRDSRHYEKMY